MLYFCYSYGIGTDINRTMAFQFYKITAENGHRDAQVSLGLSYEGGDGTEKNIKEAIYWYQKAAKNGNEFAQYNLDRCYMLGNGINKDLIKAFKYYKISAKKKYSLGYNLYGIGTNNYNKNALELCTTEAKKEHNTAQNYLNDNIKMQANDNSNEWINWIDEAISRNYIKYYEYDHFHDIEVIGSGGFGKAYRANWKNYNKYLALKSFNSFDNVTAKEIVQEVIVT